MLGYIRGSVLGFFKVGKSVSSLVVWPNEDENALGVGYSVLVSDILAAKLPKHSVVSLWLYTVQTDKESYVIGLDSSEAMDWLVKLLTVSGVGPRTALQVIDTLEVSGMQQALAQRDIKMLTKVPGLGQKTAAKIIIELGGKGGEVSAVNAMKPALDNLQEYSAVVATLQKLGWKAQEAKDAVRANVEKLRGMGDKDVSEQVKLVLSYLR